MPIMTKNCGTKRYRAFIAADKYMYNVQLETRVCINVSVNKEEAVQQTSTALNVNLLTVHETGPLTHTHKYTANY